MLDRVLETAEDLVVVNPTDPEKIVFAFPLQGEVAEHYFKQTLANGQERDVEGFDRHWQYDPEKKLITGSSTLLTLRLDKQTRKDGLWVPTVQEAKQLDAQRKLTNRVYRDNGLAVYSDSDPNQKIAGEILSQTRGETPFVVPFKAMDYRLDREFPEEVAIFLTDKQEGVLSGEQAKQYLSEQFDYQGNSGACGVDRDGDGGWGAGWVRLDFSSGIGRVDWLCGEATRTDLESAGNKMFERKYGSRIRELETERDEAYEKFTDSLGEKK
jgi:hypothetical protein